MEIIRRAFLHVLRSSVWLLQPLLVRCWFRRFNKSEPVTRVAVLLDSGVGDTLMATPMLHELRCQFPRASVLAVVDTATAQVLRDNRDVDRLCIFREGGDDGKMRWASLREVRLFRPHAMLVPQTGNTLKQILAACHSGALIRVKHRYEYPPKRSYSDYEFLYTDLPPIDDTRHRVRDNLALLSSLGARQTTEKPVLHFPISAWDVGNSERRLLAKRWSASRCTVSIHPGVGTATLKKQWPAGNFAALGRRLVAEHGVQIVLVGGKGEVELCQQIAAGVGPNSFIMAGECSLAETGAVITLSQLFISNDSGLMHLAAALGSKIVAVYGKTNPVKIGPFGGEARIVQGPDIDSISVDEVYGPCAELLRGHEVRKSA